MKTLADTCIDRMAANARAAYVAARRQYDERISGSPSFWGERPVARWDGGDNNDDPYGRRFTPIWPRFVSIASEYGVQVEHIVASRFATASGPRAPEPSDCLAPEALRRMVQWVSHSDDRLYGRLQSDQSAAALAASRQFLVNMAAPRPTPEQIRQAQLKIVGQACVPLSPLYRLWIATQIGAAQLAGSADLVADAVQQYLEDPSGYDRVWGVHVLDRVKHIAQEVRWQTQTTQKGDLCRT